MAEPDENPERDAQGRFVKGNPGGPGNPYVRRLAEYQAAIQDVISPHRFRGVMASLLKAVIERQNVQAARVIIDRVLGKSRAEPLPEGAMDMPKGLESASDVKKAADALLQGIATGVIAPEDAQRTAVIIEMARKAIETQDLEKRIADLEERQRQEKRR